jgi:hypothetical protein
MYSIRKWSPRDSKRTVWCVAEDGIIFYEATDQQDAERYMRELVRRAGIHARRQEA